MGKRIKEVMAITYSNFLEWFHSYRMLVIVVLLGYFICDSFDCVFQFAQKVGYRVHPYLLPFVFVHPYMRMIIFILIIFMFSNAPFTNGLQLYMLSRSGKRVWNIGQIVYVLLTSLLISVFITIVPVLRNISYIVLNTDWGKVLGTFPYSDEARNPIHSSIIENYMPSEAMCYTFFAVIFTCFFLGMLIYFLNTLFPGKGYGIMASGIFVLIDLTEHVFDTVWIRWISPVTWVQITKTTYNNSHGYPSKTYVMVAYVLLCTLLIGLSLFISQRRDIVVTDIEE